MAFQDYFSVVAFFIFLRETLEASVIIAVLLQCMNRTAPRLKKQVWWGAAIGIIGSIIAGGVFAAVYYVASTSLFSGHGKLIFQGCISYVACILITYLGFAMLRFSNIEQKYMRKLDGAARLASEQAKGAVDEAAPNRKHAWSVLILAASAVLREGIESVIFLAGVGSQSSFRAIPLACVAGLVVGLAVGFVIYYGGHSIKDLKIFFVISTVMLFFIAAGQVSLGTQLLSKVGMFGYYAPWADELSWQYRPVADLTSCCDDEFAGGKQFFVLAHAVVGYQARPSPIILILYCAYWAIVIGFVIYKWRNGSLFDADYKRKRTLLKLGRQADAAERKLNRCNRRISRLEGKLATAAAAGSSTAALEQQLADARQQQRELQTTFAAAEAARAAEADRLAEEDDQLAQSAAAAADQALPIVSDRSDGDSSTGSPAATALVTDPMGECKDIEMAGKTVEQQQQQQQKKGIKGLFAKLRKQ